MRKCICAGVALVISVVVAACGGSSGSPAGNASSGGGAGSSKQYAELRVGELAWPEGISFKNDGFIPAGQTESLVVQDLVEAGPSGQPKLGLASSVEHPNATTYIYNIRHGVRFSDGRPLTVADAVYSLNLNSGKSFVVKEAWEDVESVSARGNSAVVVKLKRPNPDWPNIMIEASGIIEKSSDERATNKEKLGAPSGLPIGSGPWKIDNYTPEVSIQLSRNPYWRGPRQPAEKINVSIFKSESEMALALRSGAIDVASYYSPTLFSNIPGVHDLIGPANWVIWASMNNSVPPFNDVHVRRAIAYATDADSLIKALVPSGGASPTPTIIPAPLLEGIGSASQIKEMLAVLPHYEFNLQKAKSELAKSAYPHGFTTEALAPVAEPILINVAQAVAADLAKIGVTIKIKTMQNDEWSRSYQAKMFFNEYLSYVPDVPDQMMSQLLSPSNIYPAGSGSNWPHYRNAEVGSLLTEVLGTVNRERRLRSSSKILKIVASEEPYLPLFIHSTYMALSDKFVSPMLSFYTTVYAPWALDVKLAQ